MRKRFGLRLVVAPLRRRKARASLSLAALALAACVVTALLTLYRGVQANLSHEFRRFGPNLVVTPAQGLLPRAAADAALSGGDGVGVIYAAVAANGQPLYLAGADLERLLRLNPGWQAPAAAPAEGEAWLGARAAAALHLGVGDGIAVSYAGRTAQWKVAGLVQSGGSEDSQIFAPLEAAAALTGLDGYTTLQARVAGGDGAMAAAVRAMEARLPGAEARPVRQIAAGEGGVLLRTRAMLVTSIALILLTVGLCLAAALTTLALERRGDFALMKALGGSERQVQLAFLSEAGVLGLVGAAAGMVAGAVVAGLMGRALFGLWLAPGAGTLGWVALLTVGLAVASACLPWPIIRGVTPAAILRGE